MYVEVKDLLLDIQQMRMMQKAIQDTQFIVKVVLSIHKQREIQTALDTSPYTRDEIILPYSRKTMVNYDKVEANKFKFKQKGVS